MNRRRVNTRVLYPLIAAVAFLWLGASSDSCSTSTNPKQNQSGSGGKTVGPHKPLTLKGTQYTVMRATTAKAVGDVYSRVKAPAGTTFVIATVRLVNKKNETHAIASNAIKFVGPNGKAYDTDTDASIAVSGTLILEEVQPDVPKIGKFIYIVPQTQVHGSKLRVEDFSSDAHGFIRLGL